MGSCPYQSHSADMTNKWPAGRVGQKARVGLVPRGRPRGPRYGQKRPTTVAGRRAIGENLVYPPTLASLDPEIGRRLLTLAAKAGIRAKKGGRLLRGKPQTSRLFAFIRSIRQTKFGRGYRYIVAATEPLYAWSSHLGFPIWHWVGKGWAEPGQRLHPKCRAAFKQILEQVKRWEKGKDLENIPFPKERLREYVEANFQCAGFFSQVLNIADELCEDIKYEKS